MIAYSNYNNLNFDFPGEESIYNANSDSRAESDL